MQNDDPERGPYPDDEPPADPDAGQHADAAPPEPSDEAMSASPVELSEEAEATPPPEVPDEAESAEEFENAPPAGRPAGEEQAVPEEAPEARVESQPGADEVETAAWPTANEAQPPSAEAEWPADDAVPPPSEAEAYPTPPAMEAEPSAAAHSVPATEVGESTQCPRCGTENRPGVAFCRNCGQRLVAAGVTTTVERPGAPEGTMQCPRCGTHNRTGVAFCQNCGANLRAAAAAAHIGPGYVPPAVPATSPAPTAPAAASGGAILGPIVLLVGAIGMATAWLLPFPYGNDSLWARSFGSPGGYGVSLWNGFGSVTGGVLDSAYFALAAAAPLLVLLLVLLVVAGFLRASPGGIQLIGLVIALLWSLGLIALFVALEVAGNWNGDLVALLRLLTPAGIIFVLASLIVVIGTLTRFARA
jgi:hypothetical protein